MQDPYFLRKEVSNSDLSKLKQELYPRPMPDPTQAYRFGSLLDAMITEPDRVDYFKRSHDGDVFDRGTWETALRMKDAFWRDELCQNLMQGVDSQKVMIRQRVLNYRGVEFELGVRCKWDGWRPDLGYGFDIKTITAETQSQFEAALRFFDYHRQRAFYMDIADSNYDILIGVSKKNFKVFKTFIRRGDALYREGYEDYINLAYRWWLINGEAA
ncbi:MAG: PD-(D/E)XK nuclease-like domain-containing protein [Tenuifilaceae bacterium]|jgi:hypothetical protein|nr:PD-(D/E)XK nuclease-like domain-containing protein [Tenuifilaceae bacterium]